MGCRYARNLLISSRKVSKFLFLLPPECDPYSSYNVSSTLSKGGSYFRRGSCKMPSHTSSSHPTRHRHPGPRSRRRGMLNSTLCPACAPFSFVMRAFLVFFIREFSFKFLDELFEGGDGFPFVAELFGLGIGFGLVECGLSGHRHSAARLHRPLTRRARRRCAPEESGPKNPNPRRRSREGRVTFLFTFILMPPSRRRPDPLLAAPKPKKGPLKVSSSTSVDLLTELSIAKHKFDADRQANTTNAVARGPRPQKVLSATDLLWQERC